MAGQYTDKKHTNNDAGEEPGWSCRVGSCHNLGNAASEGQQDSQHSPDHPGDHQAGRVRTENNIIYTVKKVSGFPVPSRDVMFQTLPSPEYLNYIFLARDSFVSDIPAGDGKTTNLFYSVLQWIHAF
jgi:hypothetical protein